MSSVVSRRGLVGAVLAAGGIASVPAAAADALRMKDWLDVARDFGARGDGLHDDAPALQAAIQAGSSAVRPVVVPPGAYRLRRPLSVPSNTMLIGSSLATGFGCRLEPDGCAAFEVGGAVQSFHCLVENFLIWPKGKTADHLVAVDNSYSVTFRNLRIHDCPADLKRAAVLLLGSRGEGGHGPSSCVLWDNLVVRNDVGQSTVAVLATSGCGSHRFMAPDFENFQVLLDWRGGQLDLVTPYAERAGRFAFDCNVQAGDQGARLNTFGGQIDAAASGVACALRAGTRNFSSHGTAWGGSSEHAVHAYEVPAGPVVFHGMVPNLGEHGPGVCSGVPGWTSQVAFPEAVRRSIHRVSLTIGARASESLKLPVHYLEEGTVWARATALQPGAGLHWSAHAGGAGAMVLVASNPTSEAITYIGGVMIECGLA